MCLLKFSINVQVALAAGRPRGSPGDAAGIPGELGVLDGPWGALGTPWGPWECFGFPEDTWGSLRIHGRGDLRVPRYPWDSLGGDTQG